MPIDIEWVLKEKDLGLYHLALMYYIGENELEKCFRLLYNSNLDELTNRTKVETITRSIVLLNFELFRLMIEKMEPDFTGWDILENVYIHGTFDMFKYLIDDCNIDARNLKGPFFMVRDESKRWSSIGN